MSVIDRFDGDIIRALRFQDDELLEMAADEIERLREALQKIYWATKEPEIDRIAGAALQKKDKE